MNLLGTNNDCDELLYHATKAELAPQIMATGVLPGSYWGIIEIAQYYAEVTRDEGSSPLVLAAPKRCFDNRFLAPDIPSIEEPITTVLRQAESDIWNSWGDSEKDWASCFAIVGSIRYMGQMPPAALQFVAGHDHEFDVSVPGP